jgi:hypothetical protein
MSETPTMHAYLSVPSTGQTFPLDQELVSIGRKSENSIILADDLKVSRHHATIAREGGRYMLRDVGSVNGTFVNEQRLAEPAPLADGDVVQIGDTLFTVHLPEVDTQPSLTMAVRQPGGSFLSQGIPDVESATMWVGQPAAPENPYVGPRTFTQQESNRFFGREREARELFSLVISERLVLFYAQSGAGKSSLINTRLAPQLRQAGMAVLPTGRVSGELPENVAEVDNIYIFNLLLSMDESDGPPERFARLSLSDFLTRLTSMDGLHYYYDESAPEQADPRDEAFEQAPYVLIIDQFEEIVTAHAERWPDRERFFQQLDQAMTADPMLWVVLSMREDYVANLDPYIHLIPGKLRARFYMQRMSYEAALEAIQKPALQYGRPFAPGVAENLGDNLRQLRVQGAYTPGQSETVLGQFIEPVQLQVVCYQLWENLKDRPVGQITQQDLQELGDVDKALAQFYEQALAEVVQHTGVSEVELRNWFETQLITEAGTRGTVYRGSEQTGGLDNRAVDTLVGKYLLRAEVRTGGTWYELVHDRLVDPILQANRAWSLKQPLIQMARDWVDSGQIINKLLEGQQLREALNSSWHGLGPLVDEFLAASQDAQLVKDRAHAAERDANRQRELEQARALAHEQQQRAEEQARAAASLRKRAILLMTVGAVAVVLAIIAIGSAVLASQSALKAGYAEATAVSNEAEADVARQTAVWNQELAIANEATAKAEQAIAQAASLDAIAQKGTAEAASGEAIVQQATALAAKETVEAERNLAIEARATLAANLEDILNLIGTATAEAAAAPPTNTPTPFISTPPVVPYTATPPPTETATPQPNPTIAALEVQLAEVRATQTVVAQDAQQQQIPVPPPRITCQTEPEGDLAKIWRVEAYKARLGCPLKTEPLGGLFAEQPFENGYMFWTQQLDIFIVIIGQEKGEWRLIKQNELNAVSSGVSCEPDTPPSSRTLVQPIRGFGAVWCQFKAIQQALGFGTAKEFGVDTNLIQPFERGFILRDSSNQLYLLFADENTFIRQKL